MVNGGIIFMALKQFNVKHAERWLQKLKGENMQSYKDIIKFLRKYQKSEDEHDCYLKISHTLLTHAELAKDINGFLEEGNHFIIPRADDQKLREFLGYVKNNRPEVFDRIITLIQELNRSKGQGNPDVSKMILPKLKQIIQGDQHLEQLIQQAIDMTDEDLLRTKNIEHLKVVRPLLQLPEEPRDTHLSESYVPRERKPAPELKPEQLQSIERKANVLTGNFTNSIEERLALDQLERSIGRRPYQYLVKVVKLYLLNIITRKETFTLVHGLGLEIVHLENLREILETREVDRRKHSCFKPLGDINFGNTERASPSYVTLPFFYPVRCSGKTPAIRVVTNDKWISVPYGSEENENFSVRNKNINEINLLKAEDEKYEYDLYFKRVTTSKKLIDRYLDESNQLEETQRSQLLRKAINLGVVQMIYKNCKEEQKEQLEGFLRHHPQETCQVFRLRLAHEINELRTIRDVHATKAWNETATKNYYKGLDVKGFEFRKNEKDKMKSQFFTAELNQRNKVLVNGGELKPTTLSFEGKKDFFAILNSFEGSSKSEKCSHRQLPSLDTFDLSHQDQRHFYPVMILALEDQSICQTLYSFLLFYVDSAPVSELEKTKQKIFLELYLVNYLGWKHPVRKTLTEEFNEEQLVQKINNKDTDYKPEDYLHLSEEPPILKFTEKKEEEGKSKKSMQVLEDVPSRSSYMPHRSRQKKVLYGSDHLYCLMRFLYAIYERMIKMKEVTQGTDKVELFELLFYSSIKVKESIRFEDNLNALFGDHAYLFSTIYKLFDSLLKSTLLASNCLLTSNSFKLLEQGLCEDHELLLVNRFCLQNNLTSSKLVRLTYHQDDKVLYINYFDSYYRSDQLGKDMTKKRAELSRGVQLYTIDEYRMEEGKSGRAKACLQCNGMEYTFESSSFKMHNHSSHEDLLVHSSPVQEVSQQLERELRRAHQLNQAIH